GALGAEVVLVDQAPESRPGEVSGRDLELVDEATQALTLERNAFRADQFRHQGNFRAHYLHTGPEILEQSGGRFDAFCDFAGTGGRHPRRVLLRREHRRRASSAPRANRRDDHQRLRLEIPEHRPLALIRLSRGYGASTVTATEKCFPPARSTA